MIEVKTLKAPDAELFALCIRAARLSHRSTGDAQRDHALAVRLAKAGDEHAKALRGLIVYAEINAPRYWWAEMDTYRIGAEPLGSESTMHDRPDLAGADLVKYKESLTEGTMQRRIWMISYQTLRRMYKQRRAHRLPEWRTFCRWIESLPYSEVIVNE
jgi:hypothetical protein